MFITLNKWLFCVLKMYFKYIANKDKASTLSGLYSTYLTETKSLVVKDVENTEISMKM